MLNNLIIIAVLVIAFIFISLVAIIILSRVLSNFAGKYRKGLNGTIEVWFKLLGCNFCAKASIGNEEENEEETKDLVNSDKQSNTIPFKKRG